VQRLLDAGAKVNLKHKGSTALTIAASGGNLELVQRLLDANAAVDHKGHLGNTPLFWATVQGRIEIAQCLLEAKANVDVPNTDGATALFSAALYDHTEIVRLLLHAKANANCAQRQIGSGGTAQLSGQTALGLAARDGRMDVVRLLLEGGARINNQDSHGQTPLFLAATHCQHEVVRVLLEADAALELPTIQGQTPLFGAAIKGDAKIVLMLIHAGASYDVTADITTGAGRFSPTPGSVRSPVLHAATRHRKTDMVAVLLEAKANVDLQDARGDTALALAAYNHDLDTTTLLVDVGANPTLVNNMGCTPMQQADLHPFPSVEICNAFGSRLGGSQWVHNMPQGSRCTDFRKGEKAGIGVACQRPGPDGRYVVFNLAVGSAASECGLIQRGDVLLKIDDQEATGATPSRISELILGDKGSQTTVTFEREGMEYQVTLTRGFNAVEDRATMVKAAR